MKKLIILIIVTAIIAAAAAIMIHNGRGSIGNSVIGASYDFTDATLYGTGLPVCFSEKFVHAHIGMISFDITQSEQFYTATMEQLPTTLEISLEYGDGLKWISLNFGG